MLEFYQSHFAEMGCENVLLIPLPWPSARKSLTTSRLERSAPQMVCYVPQAPADASSRFS